MYCPVLLMCSATQGFQKGKATQQWSFGVANDTVLNQVRVYHERVFADKALSKLWLVRYFASQRYSKFIAIIASEKQLPGPY